jgi:hypothetical protein
MASTKHYDNCHFSVDEILGRGGIGKWGMKNSLGRCYSDE